MYNYDYGSDYSDWPTPDDLKKFESLNVKLDSIWWHEAEKLIVSMKLKLSNGEESPIFGHDD